MKLIISPRAEKQLRKISKVDQIALVQKIRQIRDKKILVGEEKIRGRASGYRVRVGDYRIVYKRTKRLIYIVLIGHRREVYKMVRRLFG